jgi:polyphosphate kinase
MSKELETYKIHRDESWLHFNYRVLQEAKDPGVPLFERIKFLAIYSSNLDEFFRVRIASLKNLIRAGKKTQKILDYDPKALLNRLLSIVNEQQEEFSVIYENEIVPALRRNGITIKRRQRLSREQNEFVMNFFNDNMLPFVQPVLLNKNKIRPFLNNGQLYLSVLLEDKDNPQKEHKIAIVKIPSDHLPRFTILPSSGDKKQVLILDDIVRHSLFWMFPGYNIIDSYSIKMTRDAELYIDDEYSGDLVEKIKTSITKRKVGTTSRFIVDREMPEVMLHRLMKIFDIKKSDIIKEGRYHNNFDFFKFPSFGMDHLKDPILTPISYPSLEDQPSIFNQIRKQDHLLHFPYHSYESVIQFFERAAVDPNVTHIKIAQYRVAKKSRIMSALKKAVRKGKQVFVFIEAKARFDEEANLNWGMELEKAGVKVAYSFPGVKVHSKIALIRKLDMEGEQIYSYMSTGNFHEDTAKLYTDYGLFTYDERITSEVARIFNFLETSKVPLQKFENLLVGLFNLRSGLRELVVKEIENARQGLPASITLKMNSLQDKEMINLLYEASQAGVKIDLIIRGICCLIPGVAGISDNINVISVIDRFLEHSRIFVFHNNGEPKVYLSSADWMVRNLYHRIETCFPVYDKKAIKTILDFLAIQLKDNVKARIIEADQKNEYQSESSNLAIRSQLETYYYTKRQKK